MNIRVDDNSIRAGLIIYMYLVVRIRIDAMFSDLCAVLNLSAEC